MNKTFRQLLIEGAIDALGFLGGGIAAYWLTHWLGLDVFAPGYTTSSIIGIGLLGLGGGLGLQAARRIAASTDKSSKG
jgi:hypothetical protein